MKFEIVTTKAQMEDVFKVRKAVFVKEQQVPLDIEIDEYEDEATHIVGYNDAEEAIACARFRPYSNDATIKVERVAIASNQRGQGLGFQLMRFIEEQARNVGYTQAILNAQSHAQGFYERLGYQVTGIPFLEANIEHITMKKLL
ncbi:GNAT family N-acetyltransferase [Staphylococcus auricularis]|uniref:GNAT family N-acetyltransferase n=1 Tax=Staphylococcus auricularis TaxID=29379 RepID=UPI003EBDE2A4